MTDCLFSPLFLQTHDEIHETSLPQPADASAASAHTGRFGPKMPMEMFMGRHRPRGK